MPSAILIIVGVTGDLSKRKLLPTIGKMVAEGLLPKKFRILGITRQSTPDLRHLLDGVEYADYLYEHIELFPMSLTEPADYARLNTHLSNIEQTYDRIPQRLWYLAVPPTTVSPIIEQIGLSGLAKVAHTKLLLEKPFGVDGESARTLMAYIEHSFAPQQVYCIDHYLAKKTVQDIVTFRHNHPFIEQKWNGNAIERIAILASETATVKSRAVFYEQTGTLRDVVQNHLLELTALTLMTLSEQDTMPETRRALLHTLQIAPGSVYRGQYEQYRSETNNPASMVETFISLTLFSSDPRWHNVPITITAGKALAEKKTEIVVTYRHGHAPQKNPLTFCIQPDEGYERVFLDALSGDHTIFVSNDEILESWRVIDTVRKEWLTNATPLIHYPIGTTPEQVLSADFLNHSVQ